MFEISDKEKELIKQLRERVSSVWKDEYLLSDWNLYNWLHYKNFKLDKAEKAIHKNIKWRKEKRIDGILEEKFDDFYENLRQNADGVDKEGRVVITEHLMRVDMKEVLDHYCANKDMGDRFHLQVAERAFDLVKKAYFKSNGKVNSYISIVDCKGLMLKPLMSKMIELVPHTGKLAKEVERNYPGLMERTYVLNAPNKVNKLFGLIKPFLKSETAEKVKIFGKKDDKWRDVILEKISADQLRQRYGGTMPDD